MKKNRQLLMHVAGWHLYTNVSAVNARNHIGKPALSLNFTFCCSACVCEGSLM